MGAPGFDDAVIEAPDRGDAWRSLTFVYPYYENPQFLRRQIEHWSAYPLTVRKYLRVHVVDDGSPRSAAEVVLRERSFSIIRLFRIEVDVRWNWLAARNIGMHHAASGWCVLTDMDHMIPVDTVVTLMTANLYSGTVYRFLRREHHGAEIHSHPNSMAMERDTFWRIGGYDEALSGCYGTDGDWRRRCVAGARVRTLQSFIERHEYVADSSTTHYLRKQPEDARKKGIIAKRGKGWRPLTLSFPYHEVVL